MIFNKKKAAENYENHQCTKKVCTSYINCIGLQKCFTFLVKLSL
jgi:hypothetical protein